jgi:predicted CXXCH cytochrome family protein
MKPYYKNILRSAIFILHLVIFIALPISASGVGVKNTKHNLSVKGPGNAKAVTENQVCIFCHTPHNATPGYPLWHHQISEVQYINYWSPTLRSYSNSADAPPIDGFSKLCLSCHDGTIALGAITTGSGMIDTIPHKLTPENPGYLGTDLSGGHPISIKFTPELIIARSKLPSGAMQLKMPNDPYVKLYPTQDGTGVQCTSCHDPHGGRGETDAPPFWQKSTHDQVCLVCHDIISPIGH